MSRSLRFPSRLRLKSRKKIEFLFSGQSMSKLSYPLLVKYQWEVSDEPSIDAEHPTFAVSVSKKSFKKATQRNLIKRRIREAYRLNWQNHLTGTQFSMMFIYLGKTEIPFSEIEKAMIRLLKNISIQANRPITS